MLQKLQKLRAVKNCPPGFNPVSIICTGVLLWPQMAMVNWYGQNSNHLYRTWFINTQILMNHCSTNVHIVTTYNVEDIYKKVTFLNLPKSQILKLFRTKVWWNFYKISDSTAYKKLSSVLTNPWLVNGIKQASPLVQTSCVEGFHSVLNHFAPKMISFSYTGMKCRYFVLSGADNLFYLS